LTSIASEPSRSGTAALHDPSEPPLRVALIHYWLVRMRGGERVLEQVLRMFPHAELYTHVYDPEAVSELIRARPVKTTFINRFPGSRRFYQRFLPFMPLALEEIDLTGYDLVISFEAGPAKGVITSPNTLHVCYCHSPMRYLWDSYGEYKASAGWITRTIMAPIFHFLRVWDVTTAQRVDGFIANSTFIQRRIEKVYRRASVVVHPPVPVAQFAPPQSPDAYFLWVGHMTSYKRPDIALEAFNQLGLPLLMVGEGPLEAALKARAGANIRFASKLGYAEMRSTYARAQALIYTAEEDFGIIPVEALAAGRPVIAYGSGGVLDTLTDGETAIFFSEQTALSLVNAVGRFQTWLPTFDPSKAVASAARFAPEAFDHGFRSALRGFNAGRFPRIDAAIRP